MEPFIWDKAQADLLAILDRAGPTPAEHHEGRALDALIDIGYVRISNTRVVVTETGQARVRELRHWRSRDLATR